LLLFDKNCIDIQLYAYKVAMLKKRSAILASLLSLMMPGLGHMYAADIKKGLRIVVAQLSVIALLAFFGALSTFYGIWALIFSIIFFYSYALVSSFKLANSNKYYQLKAYNHWYYYLLIFIVITSVTGYVFTNKQQFLGYATYQVPSSSMSPTIKPGDFITVDTRINNISAGDVIVFYAPQNNSPAKQRTIYIKRVVALGKDNIAINNGVVMRNHQSESILQVATQLRQQDYSITMASQTVADNTLFTLGDWRDNSRDSRHFGAIASADVIGKATYIWLANDLQRIGQVIK
jgi:signal peptidase I